MAQARENCIIMQAAPEKGMRIFRIAIEVLSFCALYFLLVSALPVNAAYFIAVLPGLILSAVVLSLRHNKRTWAFVLGAAGLYTVLSIAIGFRAFGNGALSFWNAVAETVNSNTHRGWSYAAATTSFGSDFLFVSVYAMWLALGVTAVARKSRAVMSALLAAELFVLFCIGLYPAVYAIILFVVAVIGLFAVNKSFSLKATCCSLLSAVFILAAICPCFFYDGSNRITDFRAEIANMTDRMLYGYDSLPEGNLKEAGRMHASEDKLRLEVTLDAQTPTLYLKGFVGSSLSGNVWKETDRNAYVENGYQGLLGYIEKSGLPFMQFARYSALCGDVNTYKVSVKNVNANSKYTYAPYTAVSASATAAYYDLQLRGGVFASRDYSFTVFDGDRSCERITQAQWIEESAVRTDTMQAYLQVEKEYRAFVYDTYTDIPERFREAIRSAVGEVDTKSVNTATQLIRAYFLDAYVYSKSPDPIDGEFVNDFFGGEISNANASYFATAATYIFRMFGLPARYVEGYLVHADDVETGLDHTFRVTDKSAHAWTEVYFDGIGWLPIEVTPTVFSEENADTVVDPENPDIPEDPGNGTNPDEQPVTPPEPEKPDDPIIEPVVEPVDGNAALMIAVKILTTVGAVALGVVLLMLSVVGRREYIMRHKRKALQKSGAEFGRAVYAIMQHDCKPFGGFSEQTLAECGISEERTRRFIQLVEKSVYSGNELKENEKLCVIDYMEKVSAVLLNTCKPFDRFVNKYLRCIGLN